MIKFSAQFIVTALVLGMTINLPAWAGASSGKLDTTFDVDGKVTTNFNGFSDAVFDVAVQSDGKTIAAGYSDATGNSYLNLAIARYNLNGSLDGTFGVGGKVTTDFGGTSYGGAVALDSSGRIVAGAGSGIARYTSNGTLDSAFGSGGKVNTVIPVNDLAIQQDGKIVIVGTVSASGQMNAARYNSDGTLDTAFGSGGVATILSNGTGAKLALYFDGVTERIVVSGTAFKDFVVARLNANGSLDSTFGSGGITSVDFHNCSNDFYYGDTANGLTVQSGGKVTVVGSAGICDVNGVGSIQFALARLTSGGILDNTFGSAGKVITDISTSGDERLNAVALQSDGKIVVAGHSTVKMSRYDYQHQFAVARYNTNGTLDTAFGSGGISNAVIGGVSEAYALALQADGKIMTGGAAWFSATAYDFALARFLP